MCGACSRPHPLISHHDDEARICTLCAQQSTDRFLASTDRRAKKKQNNQLRRQIDEIQGEIQQEKDGIALVQQKLQLHRLCASLDDLKAQCQLLKTEIDSECKTREEVSRKAIEMEELVENVRKRLGKCMGIEA